MVNLFIACLIAHVVTDAMRDGYIFDMLYGDKKPYIVSEKNWHPIKNLSRAFLLMAGITIGLSGQVIHCLIILLLSVPALWALWQMIYNYVRYEKWFQNYDFNITKFLFFIHSKSGDLIIHFSKDEIKFIIPFCFALSAVFIYVWR